MTLRPGTSLISQRKIAVSFRHNVLLNIFQVSLQALQSLQSDPNSEARLKEQAVQLVLVEPCRSCSSNDITRCCCSSSSLVLVCS